MQITLTDRLWEQILDINWQVNKDTQYSVDMERTGSLEDWGDADKQGGNGDCEDYAEAKRQRLIALDVPREAMGRAGCYTETGEGHAVLLINTDKGTYCLDNRFDMVFAWDDKGYEWFYVPGYLKD